MITSNLSDSSFLMCIYTSQPDYIICRITIRLAVMDFSEMWLNVIRLIEEFIAMTARLIVEPMALVFIKASCNVIRRITQSGCDMRTKKRGVK